MSNNFETILQFKIVLHGISPQIWRRIQISENATFYDLHIAIQCSMGWENCHLFQFEVMDPETGDEDLIGDGHENHHGNKIKVSKYFTPDCKQAYYEYDFGDSWMHRIVFEKKLPAKKTNYPACIAGKRACPPEDCGGIWGYMNLVNTMKNRRSREYREQIEWLGEHFDAEVFDPKNVEFNNYS